MARFGLALLAQPVEHGDAVEIRARAPLPRDRVHGPRDGDLIGQAQKLELEERSGEMRRSGQHAALQDGDAARPAR